MFYENLTNEIYIDFGIMNKKERMKKVLDSEFWLNYWIEHPCLNAPTPEDLKYLKDKRYLSPLIDYELTLCTSLKALIENNMENLESTENLHQFHLTLKEELKNRDIPIQAEDSFILDINKKNKGQLISIDKARKEGICPYCNSKTNVISYGDKWKCNKCKKYFRKA